MSTFLRETTNNSFKAKRHIHDNKELCIVCIYCKNFYTVMDVNSLICKNNTLICYECSMDTMIPITTDSILFSMNNIERKNKIDEWHIEGFESDVSDESDYFDYEYEELDGEEFKDAFGDI
jgi:hypothetical protein